jgi:hypothetical protein
VKRPLLSILIIILLQGCNALAPEKEILSAFEKIAKYESELNEQQTALVKLEQQQTKLYNKIMSLGMKEFPKVTQLSQDALQIIEKRKQRIQKENERIQLAKKQLKIVEENVSHLHDEKMKQNAVRLTKIIEKRYVAYDELYDHYHKALILEKQLYYLFQNQYVTLEQLQDQISKINTAYKEIMNANDRFNDYTEQYNKEKKRLYNELT